MDAECIREIVNLAQPYICDENLGEGNFIVSKDGKITQIHSDFVTPSLVLLHSLDGLVKMVNNEAPLSKMKMFIKTESCTEVTAFSTPDQDQRDERHYFYTARAADIPGWEPVVKLSYEEAIIAIRTRFAPSADTEYMLKLLSEITNGAKITCNDNGIATTVVTQKGVALQSGVQIRPIVTLRPYRTFHELEQPECQFLIRISERGISFIEADGGMWKLEARKRIVEYLEEHLMELIDGGNVVVML